MKRDIRLPNGHILAVESVLSDGTVEVYDRFGHYLGKANRLGTVDKYGHYVCRDFAPGALYPSSDGYPGDEDDD